MLPVLGLIILSAASGSAATKGTAKIREFMNEGEKVRCPCPGCKWQGPHVFHKIDVSWSASIAGGFAWGAIGGTAKGVFADRLFICARCGTTMTEDGSPPSWNSDEALKVLVTYPSLKQAIQDLQGLVARNQTIVQQYAERIKDLERRLNDMKSDKVALENDIRLLSAQIRGAVA